MNILTVEYEGLRPMNEFGYWHYHTDQEGLPDGGMNISVELLNKYAADKVHEELDRIMSKTIDWNHIETMQSNVDAASSALNMLHEEIEAIRKELTNLTTKI